MQTAIAKLQTELTSLVDELAEAKSRLAVERDKCYQLETDSKKLAELLKVIKN
jgi:hypothetical protein